MRVLMISFGWHVRVRLTFGQRHKQLSNALKALEADDILAEPGLALGGRRMRGWRHALVGRQPATLSAKTQSTEELLHSTAHTPHQISPANAPLL